MRRSRANTTRLRYELAGAVPRTSATLYKTDHTDRWTRASAKNLVITDVAVTATCNSDE